MSKVKTLAPKAPPKARLEARVPAALHAILKRAAEIEGRSLSDFVLAAATLAARDTIQRTEQIILRRFVSNCLARRMIAVPLAAAARPSIPI